MDSIVKHTATASAAFPTSADNFVAGRGATTLPSFFEFIFKNKTNKEYFLIALFGCIAEIILFKILYPFPDFISDSYSYIDTNLYHMDVNLWPIGYSQFLWLVHTITPSHTFLVVFQYFLLELSLMYFFFSILYLYSLNKNHT